MTERGEMDGAEWKPQMTSDPELLDAVDALVLGEVIVLSSGVIIAYAMGDRLGSYGSVIGAREAVIKRVQEALK